MPSERSMDFVSPFDLAAMQDSSYIQQDAQTLPSATGRDVAVEWRTVEPQPAGPVPAQAPPGPVTPLGHTRGGVVSWQPNRWRRDRWQPAAVIAADLPPAALAALRAEVQQALNEAPEDGYYNQMAAAVIQAEQVTR